MWIQKTWLTTWDFLWVLLVVWSLLSQHPGVGGCPSDFFPSLCTLSTPRLLKDKLMHMTPLKSLFQQTSVWIGQYQTKAGFPGGTVVKTLPANGEDAIDSNLIPMSGKGNGNPLQYSCLGNPMDWWATVHGVAKTFQYHLECFHCPPNPLCSTQSSLLTH